MILDICFVNDSPEQIQNVRMISVYPHADGGLPAEVIIHSRDYTTPRRNIELEYLKTIVITND